MIPRRLAWGYSLAGIEAFRKGSWCSRERLAGLGWVSREWGRGNTGRHKQSDQGGAAPWSQRSWGTVGRPSLSR